MQTSAIASVVAAPAGEGSGALYYDQERQFLIVEGVIARGIPTFPLAPRPKRRSRAATFDSLGGNTTGRSPRCLSAASKHR